MTYEEEMQAAEICLAEAEKLMEERGHRHPNPLNLHLQKAQVHAILAVAEATRHLEMTLRR